MLLDTIWVKKGGRRCIWTGWEGTGPAKPFLTVDPSQILQRFGSEHSLYRNQGIVAQGMLYVLAGADWSTDCVFDDDGCSTSHGRSS